MLSRPWGWAGSPARRRGLCRAKIAENLYDRAAFRQAIRSMVLGPAWLFVTSLPIALLIIGTLRAEFDAPLTTVLPLYLFRMVVWGAVLILVLPAWARFAMQRNIPAVMAYISLLFVMLAFSNSVTWAFAPDTPLPDLVQRLFRQAGMGVLLSILLFMLTERSFRNLGVDPALVPVWWPVRVPQETAMQPTQVTADIGLLDPALSGTIRTIQAQNQYVEVETAEKVHLLRMPFHTALARMPDAAGHRVHRSWWLAQDVPVTLQRQGQNFAVLDKAGRSYPVSRPNLDLVRRLVNRNRAAD